MSPEIIAHRGASADAPENTLAAIQLAWQQGADAAEIDVQLTADGQLVAIHDETTLRTGGIDWTVNGRTLAELKTLDVGLWKSRQFFGERIPTLAEVLDLVPAGKRLFIEVKCGDEAIPELDRVLSAAKTTRDQTVLIGLRYLNIAAVKKAFPQRTVFWVAEQFPDGPGLWPLRPPTWHFIQHAQKAGLDGLDVNDVATRPSGDIEVIRQAGLHTCIWTVNSVERARWLRDEGMESITTDVPAKLIAGLNR